MTRALRFSLLCLDFQNSLSLILLKTQLDGLTMVRSTIHQEIPRSPKRLPNYGRK